MVHRHYTGSIWPLRSCHGWYWRMPRGALSIATRKQRVPAMAETMVHALGDHLQHCNTDN